jgi:signal transduction histidine kinase
MFDWLWGRDTDRLKYEFLTIAAHKLRTPLTRIRWEIPSLIALAGDNAALREGLVRIDVANSRLIELSNVLMEAAHSADSTYVYRTDHVDLDLLVTNAVQRFDAQIKEKNLSLVVKSEALTSVPRGDANRLGAVVDVLVENAVIYNKQGGALHIGIAMDGPRRVKLTVSDAGIGIAPEDRRHIFTSFFRSDAAKRSDTEGVGIGLAVAKRIIEKHGGTIAVDSPGEGKGSTFWFTLPV